MHPGFRYHLASLMAVFLSLVLGILIGGAIYQDSGLVEEQGLLISQMEKHFLELQLNLSILENQLGLKRQTWLRLRDFVIQDKLVGKTVFLVKNPAADWEWGSLAEALNRAGADVSYLAYQEIGDLIESEETLIIFRLGEEKLNDEFNNELSALEEKGFHLTFLWALDDKPPLFALPPGLMIDCADTALGEIALILGLASQKTGHYGLSAEAESLLP